MQATDSCTGLALIVCWGRSDSNRDRDCDGTHCTSDWSDSWMVLEIFAHTTGSWDLKPDSDFLPVDRSKWPMGDGVRARGRAHMVSAARAYLLEGVAKRIVPWLIASAREWDGYRCNWERVESAIEPNAQTRWEDGTGSTASRPKRNRGNIGQARLVMVEKISTDRRSLARERWQRKQRTLDGVPKFDDGNSKRSTKIK